MKVTKNFLEIKKYLGEDKQTKITDYVKKISSEIDGSGFEFVINSLIRLSQLIRPANEKEREKFLFTIYLTQTAEEILKSGFSIACSDEALVFAVLCRAKGIPAKFVETVFLDYLNSSEDKNMRQHAFVEVFLNNRWLIVDQSRGQINTFFTYNALGYEKIKEGLGPNDCGWLSLSEMKEDVLRFKKSYKESRYKNSKAMK